LHYVKRHCAAAPLLASSFSNVTLAASAAAFNCATSDALEAATAFDLALNTPTSSSKLELSRRSWA